MLSNFEDMNDKELVEVLQKGEPQEKKDVVGELYTRYYHSLLNTAKRMFQHDEAEEVVQETFAKLLEKIDYGEIEISHSNWYLRTMVYNLCISILRKRKWDILLEDGEFLPGYSNEPETEVISQESSQEVMQALYELPFAAELTDCPRIAWILRMLYGFSTDVVARLMSTNKGAIYTHFSEANTYVNNFLKSIGYPTLESFLKDPPIQLYRGPFSESQIIIERFAKNKKFYPLLQASHKLHHILDEIHYELHYNQNHIAKDMSYSLVLPGLNKEKRFMQIGQLQLIVTEPFPTEERKNIIRKTLLHKEIRQEKDWWKKVLPPKYWHWVNDDSLQNLPLHLFYPKYPLETFIPVLIEDNEIGLGLPPRIPGGEPHFVSGLITYCWDRNIRLMENFHQIGLFKGFISRPES